MSQSQSQSHSESNIVINPSAPEQLTPAELNAEMANLTHSIKEWRRLTGESTELSQQIKERRTKIKALEAVILRVMKSHQIGALDLKASGGRDLTKESKKQAGLGAKNLHSYLAEYMNSDTEAMKVIAFINGKREGTQTTVESLKYVTLNI